jgi:hypothetical protein
MGSLRCPVEFFLRYGLEKRAEASFCYPLGGSRKATGFAGGFFTSIKFGLSIRHNISEYKPSAGRL